MATMLSQTLHALTNYRESNQTQHWEGQCWVRLSSELNRVMSDFAGRKNSFDSDSDRAESQCLRGYILFLQNSTLICSAISAATSYYT